jgi:uncharacterized protein (TIGR00369 family)
MNSRLGPKRRITLPLIRPDCRFGRSCDRRIGRYNSLEYPRGVIALDDQTAHLPPGAQLLEREWLGFDDVGEIALVRFHARPAFTNRHGTIQGGFLAAMLDSATGLCALTALSANQTVVTKRLDTRFLKAAGVGHITAKAKIVARTDREMTVEADLVDAQGVTVARATAELRVLESK